MKKRMLVAVAFLFALGMAHPPVAEARGGTHVGIYANFGCCYGGYYPYAPYPYYAPYYEPYYVAPPPVVYAVPPPSPVAANQTSPTFIDAQGRTCRQFQSTSGGQAFGTACLQPDGSWRAVQ